ncbi:MAG TPA: TetR/AcrR family transcriptional regulator [Nocardioidaceae bacterium]|nr:TetR/AcrR family transcriptional regulator [Nocardioidaceae bacterium]
MKVTPRRRLSADDRRRQLIAIGLTKLIEKPIQDLSMDEVATEAGISRGLLFHYFPTKADFYVECMAAAGRRIIRTTKPDENDPGDVQVATTVGLMLERIARRREFYVSLIQPSMDPRLADVHGSVRAALTDRVMAALDVPTEQRALVHAWWAYVEDRALAWSAIAPEGRVPDQTGLVAHCCEALTALLDLA